MKARDIQVGDTYIDPQSGVPIWVVQKIVDVVPSHVKVSVSTRTEPDVLIAWDPSDEVENIYRPVKGGE